MKSRTSGSTGISAQMHLTGDFYVQPQRTFTKGLTGWVWVTKVGKRNRANQTMSFDTNHGSVFKFIKDGSFDRTFERAFATKSARKRLARKDKQ